MKSPIKRDRKKKWLCLKVYVDGIYQDFNKQNISPKLKLNWPSLTKYSVKYFQIKNYFSILSKLLPLGIEPRIMLGKNTSEVVVSYRFWASAGSCSDTVHEHWDTKLFPIFIWIDTVCCTWSYSREREFYSHPGK